jgi:dCTP diphosphatase
MEKLQKEIRKFVTERDWQQFHSPKNLAMALTVETAELQEIFQWLTEEASYSVDNETLGRIEEEIGDVMIYLTTLAAKYNIDPIEAAMKKMKNNIEKYPADTVRGKSAKYDTY